MTNRIGTPLHVIVPPKGTHGFRKIDGFLAPQGHCSMLERCPGFDHVGVLLHATKGGHHFHDAHQSGRFDASPHERWVMVKQLTGRASVGAVTESIGLGDTILKTDFIYIGRETKILFDPEVWRLVDHGVIAIPTNPWKRGNATRHSVDITWAVLGNRETGLGLLRFAGHLPAHLYRPAQLKANRAALHLLGPSLQPIVSEYKPGVTHGSFDFNRALNLSRNKRLIERAA